jgi:undecaprenyl-diphosphatase
MISFLADWLMIIIVLVSGVLILTGLGKGDRIEKIGMIIVASLLGLTIARIMGFLPIEMVRPFVQEAVAPGASYMDNPGFPSDHALLAFTCAYAVIFMTKFKKLGWLLFVLSTLVGLGRVLALVHTSLDVLGGLAAASLGSVWYMIYFQYIRPRRQKHTRKKSR